ncbi:uncharacterized protein EI97DRAFT_273185 [Westerdykella ornata]|uniref:CBM21 domain-containing protein n=1 Tax=Westerdykella ornata TaxID=318751 RepID=A0A6A6JPF4_WESOR|nr:uncharacterized protein EI97DRAFT_273185 [Westerdykella ornata]KAF2277788.1 hypothetical protein EI97DRAFT_273185 [Westerdykella ornata]
MPYTPPTQQSPASSKPNSPIISRSHSYTDHRHLQLAQKPALPRSVSSTSYITKHRRSPSTSIQDTTAANTVSNGTIDNSSETTRGRGSAMHGSVRPTPYVSKRLTMPPGAVTTPPDSSDDDEEQRREIGNLKELHHALQSIDVRRERSPNREETPDAVSIAAAPGALSPEARKISHSRSSSEIMLSAHGVHLDPNPIQTSSENSDAEDELRIKPPLLRKKSGELVKPALRPASRRRPSSMPGTPTYHKAVHFNEDMEQVRHFLRLDKPIAVSAGSSPVDTYDSESDYPWGYDDGYRSSAVEWEIKLANFPGDTFERRTAPVRVERLFLASDNKTLIGTVAVANIAYHKVVVARFTLDYWNTTSEVVAEYNQDVRKKQASDGYDRFNFSIKLADQANLETKKLLLCVRYNVNGQEYWDNNNHQNYQIDFVKKVKQRGNPNKSSHGLGAIPRSRNSPTGQRRRSVDSFDDDFDHVFESKFQFGSGRVNLSEPTTSSIRFRPKSKRGNLDQDLRRNPTGSAFSSRYDFTASLTAALSNAQNALGSRSGITQPSTSQGGTGGAGIAPIPGTRPDALSPAKTDLRSAEYNELIQKFCFFGTSSGKGSSKSAPRATSDSVSIVPADDSSASGGSRQSSASSSPGSPNMPLAVDGGSDPKNHFASRSTSPGPVTGSAPEDLAHSSSYQQYGYGMHGGIFPERSHTPQACV